MLNFKTFRNAVQNLIRNKWLTFATVTIMTITLFTISLFVMINLLINVSIGTIESRIDLEAYIKDSATEEQIEDMEDAVSKKAEVKSTKFVSKSEALKIFKEKFKEDQSLIESISESDNPLPRSLKINLDKAESLEGINNYLRKGEFNSIIDNTSYEKNKNDIKSWISFRDYVNKGGIILSLIFILTSLIVVLNTIKMTIFTRKEEIEIMRLVGATNWYIRWPFILEGAFYGIISMFFATSAVLLGLKFGKPNIIDYFGEYGLQFFDSLATYGFIMLAWQLGISILVGVISSSMAIGRYLRN